MNQELKVTVEKMNSKFLFDFVMVLFAANNGEYGPVAFAACIEACIADACAATLAAPTL